MLKTTKNSSTIFIRIDNEPSHHHQWHNHPERNQYENKSEFETRALSPARSSTTFACNNKTNRFTFPANVYYVACMENHSRIHIDSIQKIWIEYCVYRWIYLKKTSSSNFVNAHRESSLCHRITPNTWKKQRHTIALPAKCKHFDRKWMAYYMLLNIA